MKRATADDLEAHLISQEPATTPAVMEHMPKVQCPADNPHQAHVWRPIITGRQSSIQQYCPGMEFHPTVTRLFALAKDRTRGEGVTERLVGQRAYRAVLAENLFALIAGLDSSTRDDLVVLLVRQGWDLLNTEVK